MNKVNRVAHWAKVARAAYSVNRSIVNTVQYKLQDQLYLHQFNNELTTVSFSKDYNKVPIGTVKVTGKLEDTIVNVRNFVEHKDFFPVLHKTFFDTVYDDQTYIFDAMNYPGSFMAISDYKVILDYMNQRPDMANTIGFVHVDFGGEMERGSYQPNEMYTLCNIDGVITLSENMKDQLQKYI